MSFRYFQHPHEFSTYTKEPQLCDFCGEERPGYAGPYYGQNDIEFVCEACLIQGRLTEAGASTNEGSRLIRNQLQLYHPELSPEQREALVIQRIDELEYRTPSLVTWNDIEWPGHCGDYCRFIKIAGRPDIVALAGGRDAKAFFYAHLMGRAHPDWWADIRPDSPRNNEVAYSMEVYLFQCLECGEYRLITDME